MRKNQAREAAKAKGDMFYFTGIPCTRGHIADRYVSVFKCVECANEEMELKKLDTIKRRALRPLSVRQQSKADGLPRYNSGEPCPRGHSSDRYTSNGTCIKCCQDDRLRKGNSLPSPEIQQRQKLYRKNNAERYRAHVRNRRAAAKLIPGSHDHDDIAVIAAAQNYRCAYCCKSIRKAHHVDHIIAISKGGTNWPNNIQLTCPSCNLRKHNKDPIDFASELGKLL